MKRELQLSDISCYLPYGLKTKGGDDIRTLHGFIGCMGSWIDEDNTIRRFYDDSGMCFFKPILREMSSLTSEITHKGETFVPIVELAKIHRPDLYWTLYRYSATAIIPDAKAIIPHSGDDGSIKVQFSWSKWNNGFCELSPSGHIYNQHELFHKLNEWMFDYRGLIDAGLAISITDIKEGVYE